MASIGFEGVSKVFPDGTRAVDELTLDLPDGGFTVLVGPSGSGKSTALRMVAGLEDITSGTIRIGDRVVNDIPPRDRDIAMVFQSYALYPHMNVADNMGFALKMQGQVKASIRELVGGAANRLGIGELLERRPRALSGGQRQRVALGRAIVREPAAFLMDEPLSNLDAKLRVEMRAYLARLHLDLGTTTLYVTHDQIEAMTMGDRVAVMRDGRLEQVDSPQRLYDHPANMFVASFMGSPAMNLVRGRLTNGDGRVTLALGTHELRVPDALLSGHPALAGRVGEEIVVGIRPELIELAESRNGDGAFTLELPVALTEALGSDLLVHAELDAESVAAEEDVDVDLDVAAGKSLVTARLSPQSGVKAGAPVRLRVDMDHVHFFAPDSGIALA
jgi:multiple sugar transport system ATP-binding protein